MNSKTETTTRPLQILAALRDDLRERREARAADRQLVRELSSYRTRAEADDLLGAIRDQHGPDADRIRAILSHNLSEAHLHRIAS